MTGACYFPGSLVKFIIWYVAALVKKRFYLDDYLVYLFPTDVAAVINL